MQTGSPQQDAFFEEGHTQLLHTLGLQVASHRHQTVPVGIGLDDRHHRHARMRAQGTEVMRQGIEIDPDPGRTVAGFRLTMTLLRLS